MSAASEQVSTAAPTTGLTERDREIIAFERQWWKYAGSKETAIKELMSKSSLIRQQALAGGGGVLQQAFVEAHDRTGSWSCNAAAWRARISGRRGRPLAVAKPDAATKGASARVQRPIRA